MRISVYMTGDPYLPLDRRWEARAKFAGKMRYAHGATAAEARAALQRKLDEIEIEDAESD